MSKTTARLTLADIARATRAAKEQGAEAVEINVFEQMQFVLGLIAYRKSWFEEVGYKTFPETWDALRTPARN